MTINQTKNYCRCGCGKLANVGKKFLPGHNRKLNPCPTRRKKIRRVKRVYCECGCGQIVSNNKKFIKGHNMRVLALSEEWRTAKSLALTGRKLTPEAISDMTGPNNHNWRGGKSFEPYCQEMYIKEFKDSIKECDGYKCQNPHCWGKCIILCVHHINYNKKNCQPANLITLCLSCNVRANYNREFWEALYTSIKQSNLQPNSNVHVLLRRRKQERVYRT